MSKNAVIYMILTILLGAGLVVGVVLADMKAAQEQSCGVKICLVDTANKFMTREDAMRKINEIVPYLKDVPLFSINLHAMETHLNEFENVEWAQVERRYVKDSAYVYVKIMAMQPVARIIDGGKSYYVNKDGKRLLSNYAYRADVPVFVAHLDSAGAVKNLLPLIDFLKEDSVMNKYFTSYKVESSGDIIAYPMVSNHVINLGDVKDLRNKAARLREFYAQVMPLKGWEYYDTISLKWRGQVVATRRKKASLTPKYDYSYDSIGSMESQIDAITAIPDSLMTQRRAPSPKPKN